MMNNNDDNNNFCKIEIENAKKMNKLASQETVHVREFVN